MLAGLVGSFPVDASPPRTGALVAAGGRTQAGALGAAAAVLLLIPFAGFLKDLPLATLAAILIFIAVRLFDGRDLAAIYHFNLFEFGLAAVTLLAVVLIGVEQGIGVAVGLAILDRIRLSSQPQLHVMGRIPGTTSWTRPALDATAETVPGVLVVLFATPLWYANAVALPRAGVRRFGGVPRDRACFVLDAIGMSDIDFTGIRPCARSSTSCERDGIAFGVARAGVHASTTACSAAASRRASARTTSSRV